MPGKDAKLEALRQQGTLNPRPDEVTDERFAAHSFFDPRDLVQVKYEMLRRVQADGKSITDAAASFGFSRPSFYQAQSAFEHGGLAGLVPRRRGPKQAHKLTEEVLAFVRETRQNTPAMEAAELARLIHQRFGTTVHPQSIRRALLRHQKKTSLSGPTDQPVARPDLVTHYEQLRRDAADMSSRGREALGLALFLRRGMAAWMQAWSQCIDCVTPPAPSQPATTPVPMDVRAQVAMLLAGIILDIHQEATI